MASVLSWWLVVVVVTLSLLSLMPAVNAHRSRSGSPSRRPSGSRRESSRDQDIPSVASADSLLDDASKGAIDINMVSWSVGKASTLVSLLLRQVEDSKATFSSSPRRPRSHSWPRQGPSTNALPDDASFASSSPSSALRGRDRKRQRRGSSRRLPHRHSLSGWSSLTKPEIFSLGTRVSLDPTRVQYTPSFEGEFSDVERQMLVKVGEYIGSKELQDSYFISKAEDNEYTAVVSNDGLFILEKYSGEAAAGSNVAYFTRKGSAVPEYTATKLELVEIVMDAGEGRADYSGEMIYVEKNDSPPRFIDVDKPLKSDETDGFYFMHGTKEEEDDERLIEQDNALIDMAGGKQGNQLFYVKIRNLANY